jgi:hypothetical protein
MAFDIKAAGLGIAEDTTVAVIKKIVRPFAEDMILKSENKLDDVLLPFLQQLEDALVGLAEKIDASDNNVAAKK